MPLQDEALALIVQVAQILETGFVLDAAISPQALHIPQGEEIVFREPVRVQGRLTKVAEQIYFQGSIRGKLMVPCSRCLDVVHTEFATEVRVIFLPPTSEAVSGEEGTVGPTDDLDVFVHDGTILDLRPLIREQVVLAFPVQPLCREDCAGLCQVCGGNRNVEQCTCQTETTDPRFAILKQLRFPGAS
jgi:uncharacterized protein